MAVFHLCERQCWYNCKPSRRPAPDPLQCLIPQFVEIELVEVVIFFQTLSVAINQLPFPFSSFSRIPVAWPPSQWITSPSVSSWLNPLVILIKGVVLSSVPALAMVFRVTPYSTVIWEPPRVGSDGSMDKNFFLAESSSAAAELSDSVDARSFWNTRRALSFL